MKIIVSGWFVGLTLLLLACGGGDAPSTQSIADGKKIFKMYCIACHGEDGKLALNGAKDFTASTLNMDERIAIITNGRNLMTPYKGILKEEEIKSVAAYTMELSKGKK